MDCESDPAARRVVIVDGDRTDAERLHDLLAADGIEVDGVTTADAGLAAAVKRPTDAVFVHLTLGTPELVARLRALAHPPRIVAISPPDAAGPTADGFDALVETPLGVFELLAALRKPRG